MSSDPKGPETIPLTAEADEHEGHYAWEVEPFDPEGPVGIVISMADVECGQPLDATLVVLADSDDEREVEWARSTADDIAARLNEHQAQAATIAALTTRAEEAEARVAELTAALGEAVSWMEATNDYESLSPVGHALTRDAIQKARAAMEETR